MNLQRRVRAFAIALALISSSEFGHAYCRQTTCDPGESGDLCERRLDNCVTEGLPLFQESCLSFAIARDSGKDLGFSDEDFLSLTQQAFDRWATVDCGGGQSPGFVVVPGLVVDSQAKFFCWDEPRLNLSVWSFEAPWPYPEEADSLGFTTSIFDVATGEIFDADVELNLPKIARSEVPVEDRERQVLAILTHEAGHFLGLAHSDEPDAVMAARYTESELLTKQLTQDDVDGICAIYPPASAPDECAPAGVSRAALDADACDEAGTASRGGGCSIATVSGPAGSAPPVWWGLGALLLYWRRRPAASCAAPQ